MLETLSAHIESITAQMGTTEWLIAAVVLIVLIFAIVKQAVKLAVIAAILFLIGYAIMHAQAENWSLSF